MENENAFSAMHDTIKHVTIIDHEGKKDKIFGARFALKMMSKGYVYTELHKASEQIEEHYILHHGRKTTLIESQGNIQAYHCELLDWWIIIEFGRN